MAYSQYMSKGSGPHHAMSIASRSQVSFSQPPDDSIPDISSSASHSEADHETPRAGRPGLAKGPDSSNSHDYPSIDPLAAFQPYPNSPAVSRNGTMNRSLLSIFNRKSSRKSHRKSESLSFKSKDVHAHDDYLTPSDPNEKLTFAPRSGSPYSIIDHPEEGDDDMHSMMSQRGSNVSRLKGALRESLRKNSKASRKALSRIAARQSEPTLPLKTPSTPPPPVPIPPLPAPTPGNERIIQDVERPRTAPPPRDLQSPTQPGDYFSDLSHHHKGLPARYPSELLNWDQKSSGAPSQHSWWHPPHSATAPGITSPPLASSTDPSAAPASRTISTFFGTDENAEAGRPYHFSTHSDMLPSSPFTAAQPPSLADTSDIDTFFATDGERERLSGLSSGPKSLNIQPPKSRASAPPPPSTSGLGATSSNSIRRVSAPLVSSSSAGGFNTANGSSNIKSPPLTAQTFGPQPLPARTPIPIETKELPPRPADISSPAPSIRAQPSLVATRAAPPPPVRKRSELPPPAPIDVDPPVSQIVEPESHHSGERSKSSLSKRLSKGLSRVVSGGKSKKKDKGDRDDLTSEGYSFIEAFSSPRPSEERPIREKGSSDGHHTREGSRAASEHADNSSQSSARKLVISKPSRPLPALPPPPPPPPPAHTVKSPPPQPKKSALKSVSRFNATASPKPELSIHVPPPPAMPPITAIESTPIAPSIPKYPTAMESPDLPSPMANGAHGGRGHQFFTPPRTQSQFLPEHNPFPSNNLWTLIEDTEIDDFYPDPIKPSPDAPSSHTETTESFVDDIPAFPKPPQWSDPVPQTAEAPKAASPVNPVARPPKSKPQYSFDFPRLDPRMSREVNGTLDWSSGLDYEGYEWFKDPPPKDEPLPPSSPSTPFEPSADVVEHNEAAVFALQAAPNVLAQRFKLYGQLGVLGWSSEFSELIDDLKTLGFDGNMFTSTRDVALETCRELLRLELDVKMQLIILYFTTQVARLRRFLDEETEYDDYPEPNFIIPSDHN